MPPVSCWDPDWCTSGPIKVSIRERVGGVHRVLGWKKVGAVLDIFGNENGSLTVVGRTMGPGFLGQQAFLSSITIEGREHNVPPPHTRR